MNVVRTTRNVANCSLVSVLGDLTKEPVEAIVNAANGQLRHGGGVAGAILRAGGPTIQQESLAAAPVATGQAVITGAGTLPARFVIHAVGPIWGGGHAHEEQLLVSAVTRSLLLADARHLQSVSMPAISAGIFGYPPDQAVPAIVQAAADFARTHPDSSVTLVRFCALDETMASRFDRALENL